MRNIRTRSEDTLLGLPSLLFVYLLLVVLGLAYSSTFVSGALTGDGFAFLGRNGGGGPPPALFLVLIGIPAVLLVFLVVQVARAAQALLEGHPAARLRMRLFVSFFAVAALASLPVMAVSSRFAVTVVKVWFSEDRSAALKDARGFALEAYRRRLADLERAAQSPELESVSEGGAGKASADALRRLDQDLLSIQTFARDAAGRWSEASFAGDRRGALPAPPVAGDFLVAGFIPRDPRRDPAMARYLVLGDGNRVLVITMDLGPDFDLKVARIDDAIRSDESLASMEPVLGRLMLALYGLFALPTLLMTVIIAFRFSDQISRPIASLEAATRRVADGDFDVRIIPRKGDELSALVSSFNAMVRDLSSSRDASIREEKINTWQDIAQRLAHEIKNPLTPIKLTAERVLRRWRTDSASVGDILEPSMLAIAQEVDGLSNLLSEFRQFARLPDPNREWTKVRSLIADSVALYATSYPEVSFDYGGVGEDLVVNADPRHLSQVLSNLVVNAVDAMKGRGTIQFKADLVQKEESRYCRISVRDDGSGISESAKPLIFMPYFTTKDTGTGLGLAIVERLVSGHGGSVWVESEEGAGSTFYIDLPVDKPPQRGNGETLRP